MQLGDSAAPLESGGSLQNEHRLRMRMRVQPDLLSGLQGDSPEYELADRLDVRRQQANCVKACQLGKVVKRASASDGICHPGPNHSLP